MKNFVFVFLLFIGKMVLHGQSQEMEQLRLDLEKLVQMKAMLKNMYNGYTGMVKGYQSITTEAKENFDLHKYRLDELLQVKDLISSSPVVQHIHTKAQLLSSEMQSAYLVYLRSGLFGSAELLEIKTAFDQLQAKVAQENGQLKLVMTPGALRMSDQERLMAIGQIDKDVGGALASGRMLIKTQNQILLAREQRKKEVDAMRSLYGLKN